MLAGRVISGRRPSVGVLLAALLAASACAPGREARIDEVLRRSRAAPERVVELESPFLSDPDRDVRALAAWAIGSAVAPGAAESLTPLASDPDAAVRRAVAIALCSAGGETGRGTLAGLSADPDPVVRRSVLRCFAASATGPAEVLTRAVQDDDREVRTLALAALARRPEPASLPALETVLGSRDPDEQLAAVKVIRALGSPGALPALERAAASRLHPSVRDAIEAAILDLRAKGLTEPVRD